jgi:hypothetical protein
MLASGAACCRRSALVGLAALLIASGPARGDLVITGVFTGGAPPADMVGGGNLTDIFNAAAVYWERAFTSPSDHWAVTVQYGWAPLMFINGEHILLSQGGTPNREISGQIHLDNSGNTHFFADPNPFSNAAYQTYTEYSSDIGGGTVNTGRIYTATSGPAAGNVDLLTIVEHEIGHALGVFFANLSYQAQVPGNTLEITAPLPYAGSTIFMLAGHIDSNQLGTALMSNIQPPSERIQISAIDVLAEAQISQFFTPNLNPYAVPEPSAAALLAAGLLGWSARAWARARRARARYAAPAA